MFTTRPASPYFPTPESCGYQRGSLGHFRAYIRFRPVPSRSDVNKLERILQETFPLEGDSLRGVYASVYALVSCFPRTNSEIVAAESLWQEILELVEDILLQEETRRIIPRQGAPTGNTVLAVQRL